MGMGLSKLRELVMDREAWRAAIHGVAKSRTRLSDWTDWLTVVTELCPTLMPPHGLLPTRLLCPWDFPGKNTGANCHFLLQGVFTTQGLNLHLLHWQVESLPLPGEPSVQLSWDPLTGELSRLLSGCWLIWRPDWGIFLRVAHVGFSSLLSDG